MSLLLKGFKMPKTCMNGGCPIDGRYCDLWYKAGGGSYGRHRNCPLIELSEHGDLVDVDLLKAECKEPNVWWETETQMAVILNDAPVVIPAERSEDA